MVRNKINKGQKEHKHDKAMVQMTWKLGSKSFTFLWRKHILAGKNATHKKDTQSYILCVTLAYIQPWRQSQSSVTWRAHRGGKKKKTESHIRRNDCE